MLLNILIRNKKFGAALISTDSMRETLQDEDFITNMFEDDDVVDRSSLVVEPILKNINGLLEAHYDMTGSLDNIDIKISRISMNRDDLTDLELYYDVYVKHGDIEIKNARNECTLLKGVYTKSSFVSTVKRTKMRRIDMFRDTYNEIELHARYMHSHVPSLGVTRIGDQVFKQMCLGSASIVRFRRGRKYQDMFMYLAYLDSFIKWESLDGGPYNKICELYSVASDSMLDLNNVDVTDVIYNNADNVTAYIDSEGNLSVSSDIINHIDDDKLKCVNYRGYTMKEDGWHVDYLLDPDAPTVYNSVYVFRGKPLKIRIIPYDNSLMKKYAKSCYNQVPKKLGNKLVKKIDQILKLYYEPKQQEVPNLQSQGEGQAYSN